MRRISVRVVSRWRQRRQYFNGGGRGTIAFSEPRAAHLAFLLARDVEADGRVGPNALLLACFGAGTILLDLNEDDVRVLGGELKVAQIRDGP